ncbi:RDD family protein [Nitratireductor aquimarinus]|uniref:RDD family protein n=1 Tax=Alphaproteobacteria TaxID=28211 RepID=UPI0019D3994E|nr:MULTISPECIES: RDD family protein [Alphaproteobacteria]MBY6023867.1 RDD family protein [Nitratireductor sp. DP7N14-4]MBN7759299.1 RDD family protein [Nitratireductor aquimarinus]MBN7763444.1 RDD family protein [Nitratireductor aquibiodomus]MBN8241705.1 RDD family protein [Nitratireductor aquimarinus]MBY6001579.1 RDD family protein [Tritonibacter mobilis]
MTATRPLDGEIIDPARDDWHLYRGVRTRRIFAFCIDYLLIGLMMVPVAIIVALLGVMTLGLGWLLFGILAPLTALLYVAMTLGGRRQATLGMQFMDVKLVRLDGGRVDSMLAVVHTVLFWAGNAVLTPLILLASLFLDYKRTVHDLLLGTVVVRTS